MGNCCGTQLRSFSGYVKDDTEVQAKSDVYNPSLSSLFNALRKNSQLVVLHPGIAQSLLPNTMAIDFQTQKPNYIKTLLNFKKVVFIGHYDAHKNSSIRIIKEVANTHRFYLINQSYCSLFLKEFPIFQAQRWDNHQIVTSDVPILVIDTRDFVDCSEKRKIFIHSAHKKDMKKYSLIGVDSEKSIIKECSNSNYTQAMQYYMKELDKNSSKNIVVLHDSKLDPDILPQVFATYIKEEYKIPTPYVKMYLARSLPKANFNHENETKQETKPIPPPDEYSSSATSQFKELFVKMQDQAGMQKTNRAFQLLNTLTTNIYSHTDESMYRKVKRTTRQVVQLSKYSAFVKLLQKLGWKQQAEFWVNNVQSKYLKIFKTDLDIGFKQFNLKNS